MASNGSFQGRTETEDSDIVSLSVEKQGHIHVLHGDEAGSPRGGAPPHRLQGIHDRAKYVERFVLV